MSAPMREIVAAILALPVREAGVVLPLSLRAQLQAAYLGELPDKCPKGHRQLWLGDHWERCRTCAREGHPADCRCFVCFVRPPCDTPGERG
jgi:hypothetical protein